MKPRTLYLWTIGIAIGVALGACSAGSSSFVSMLPSAHHHSGSSPIEHVVIIVQENRSFDNLFATFPGANGTTYGCAKPSSSLPVRTGRRASGTSKCPPGDEVIKLAERKLIQGYDLNHCHSAFETDYDGGLMDGFYEEGKGACVNHTPKPCSDRRISIRQSKVHQAVLGHREGSGF